MRSILALILALSAGIAGANPRARDLGVPFDGEPGPLNAITDVTGVTVGHVTLIEDLAGGHRVRTGVTAILPRGKDSLRLPVFAGTTVLNGAGEMTGAAFVNESGFLDGPVMITNTHSIGAVHEATIAWRVKNGTPDHSGYWWSTPMVAETWDGHLNDINGFHVKAGHVARALETASGGPVAEGNVGGGTGMICHEFKCGVGTASRRVTAGGGLRTLGVLVQANYGVRRTLRIAGVPVGRFLQEGLLWDRGGETGDTGSIIIVVATDAPLLPHQLARIARRAGMGLARMGSYSGDGSGDLFVAFSTANAGAMQGRALERAEFLDNGDLDPLFDATVQATEEAIVNAMVAARDMEGEAGHVARAIPQKELVELLRRYNRLEARP